MRDKAFLELFLGLRVSEAVNVNIASFESDLNFVKVLVKEIKRMLSLENTQRCDTTMA